MAARAAGAVENVRPSLVRLYRDQLVEKAVEVCVHQCVSFVIAPRNVWRAAESVAPTVPALISSALPIVA